MGMKATFDIAGIRYSLEKEAGEKAFDVDQSHQRFLTTAAPDLRYRTVDGRWPEIKDLRRGFDSTSWWTMFEAPDAHVISFYNTTAPYAENRRAVLAPDFRSGTIYCDTPMGHVTPLSYPLEELIFISVLPSYDGVIIHSCGAGDENGGYLFVGVSGAGKSTISKVLMTGTDWKVLSDDRIILRKIDGRIRMFGTPWHGEVDVCENMGIPLRRVYFLRKASANSAVRWSPVQAATHLIARSFPPFWNAEGMDRTTQLCVDIATLVPCYELGFMPDASVLDCMAGLKDDMP